MTRDTLRRMSSVSVGDSLALSTDATDALLPVGDWTGVESASIVRHMATTAEATTGGLYPPSKKNATRLPTTRGL